MNNTKIHHYKIHNDKVCGKRIILLSDIHYYTKEEAKTLNIIYDKLKTLKFNYICLSGDILDRAYTYDNVLLINWFIKISKLAPVIIALGNHDLLYKKPNIPGCDEVFWKKVAKLDNVFLLRNNSICIDNINFIGIEMNQDYYYTHYEPDEPLIKHINNCFDNVDSNFYNVILYHSPIVISKNEVLNKIKISKNLDLILCGHTHGGITPEFLKPILRGRGIISPQSTFLFKYAYGHFKVNKTDIIVSSGVTKASFYNKFHALNPLFSKEITVIDFIEE